MLHQALLMNPLANHEPYRPNNQDNHSNNKQPNPNSRHNPRNRSLGRLLTSMANRGLFNNSIVALHNNHANHHHNKAWVEDIIQLEAVHPNNLATTIANPLPVEARHKMDTHVLPLNLDRHVIVPMGLTDEIGQLLLHTVVVLLSSSFNSSLICVSFSVYVFFWSRVYVQVWRCWFVRCAILFFVNLGFSVQFRS
jgi:hypothetical protein